MEAIGLDCTNLIYGYLHNLNLAAVHDEMMAGIGIQNQLPGYPSAFRRWFVCNKTLSGMYRPIDVYTHSTKYWWDEWELPPISEF